METDSIYLINDSISKSKYFICHYYMETFKEIISIENEESKYLIKLLIDITSYYIDNDNREAPFQSLATFGNQRTASIDDLNDGDIQLLIKIYEDIEDYELKARIADIIWVKNKTYTYAIDAIDFYVLSAKRIEDWDNYIYYYDITTRALNIALSLGKTNPKIGEVNKFIISTIKNINGNDQYYLTGKLIELLLKQKDITLDIFMDIIDKCITSSLDINDFQKARYYSELKSKCLKKMDFPDKSDLEIEKMAFLYTKEAEYLENKGLSNQMNLIYLHEKAIETYRRISGKQSEVNKLLKKVEVHKLNMKNSLKLHSTTVDVSDIIDSIEDALKGKKKLEAIVKLAYIHPVTPKEDLEEAVKKTLKNSPLLYMINSDIVDKSGKRIIRMPNIELGSLEDNKSAIEAYMLREAGSIQQLFGGMVVEHGIRILKSDHFITKNDLRDIVEDNIFIPKDRVDIFLEGLYQGFNQNFMVASHLLIPQLENSFRMFAEACGDIITSFEDDGSEQVKSLNTIFELENFVEAYDEDLIINLRALLTEKYGLNMRNRIAHGLCSSDELSSAGTIYVWWISLKLCCMYSKRLNNYIYDNFFT